MRSSGMIPEKFRRTSRMIPDWLRFCSVPRVRARAGADRIGSNYYSFIACLSLKVVGSRRRKTAFIGGGIL